MFQIFLNINSISLYFIANQNGVRYSDSTSYFKKYSSSKCKQTVCLHYGLDFHFKLNSPEEHVDGVGGEGAVFIPIFPVANIYIPTLIPSANIHILS